jgi:ankyrin repeat protein
MPPPQLPLEILLMIAHLLTDEDGYISLSDFNSFLRVNRALYACLNRTLWREAAEFQDITERVFTHLIHTNDLARLKYFLELDADVETHLPEFVDWDYDIFCKTEKTPLNVVVGLDNVPMARLLLEHDANLDQYDEDDSLSYSAIHAARSAEMVQLLMDHNADPEQQIAGRVFTHCRPLHFYAEQGNIEAMRVVLQNGVEVDPRRDAHSPTPLYIAARRNFDAVKLLLEYGADAKKTYDGRTPLHCAASWNKTEVVRLLLELWPEGAREKDSLGSTPLHSAVIEGNTEVVRLLVEGCPEGSKEKNKDGNTPLHLAAKRGRTSVVRLLVENWPEGVREKNKWGYTPLHLAAEKENTEVVRLLVESWPDKEVLNKDR